MQPIHVRSLIVPPRKLFVCSIGINVTVTKQRYKVALVTCLMPGKQQPLFGFWLTKIFIGINYSEIQNPKLKTQNAIYKS